MVCLQAFGRTAAFSMVVLLASCGGGGGSASSPPPVGRASLIPSAPTLGDVLYADDTSLRPTAAGSTWTYHGSHTLSGQNQAPYDDTISQAVSADGGFDESATNIFDGGSQVSRVQIDATAVRSTQTNYNGDPLPALSIELRSPVRVGDQYTIDEESVADSGYDIDGDGKHDAVDFAIYRRVIGNETVPLTVLGDVTALRVDTMYLTRFIGSATQTASPVTTFVQSIWYAPDLGVVRQSITIPTASGGSEVWDEQLTRYQGAMRGAGLIAEVPAVVPQDGSVNAGLTIPDLFDAIRVGDHVLARTGQPGQIASPRGFYFAVIDQGGQVTALRDYGDLVYGGIFQMLPAGDGFAVVQVPTSGDSSRVFTFDSQARLTSSRDGINFDLKDTTHLGSYLTSASFGSGGDGFWAIIRRFYVNTHAEYVYQLAARHYNYAGAQVGLEVLLAENLTSSIYVSPKISASGNRVIALWGNADNSSTVAEWNVGDTVPEVHSLGYATPTSDVSLVGTPSSGSFAGTWFNGGPGFPAAIAGGVQFDSQGAPVLPVGLTQPDNQVISTTWGGMVKAAVVSADPVSGYLMAASIYNGLLWPTDLYAQPLYAIASYPPSDKPLSAQTPHVMRFEGDGDFVVRLLSFDDRYIVLRRSPNNFTASVVWR